MCGISGFYPKKGKKVNLNKLYALGIGNEERGTDSCGISVGNFLKKGTYKDKVARDFIYTLQIEETLSKIDLVDQPCIFHTRRATGGLHNEENAHPFIFNYTNDKEYYFVGCHNGIIRSTTELKNKFCPNYDQSLFKIDTHYILLSLFATIKQDRNREVLKSYEGKAALLFYNSDGLFKAWKGANNNVEERSLFYMESAEGWYFSSIPSLLAAIGTNLNKYPIEEIRNNELITFKDGMIYDNEIIERKIVETVVTPAYSYSFNRGNHGTVSTHSSGYTHNQNASVKKPYQTKTSLNIKYNNELYTYTSAGRPLRGNFYLTKHDDHSEFSKASKGVDSIPIYANNGILFYKKSAYKEILSIIKSNPSSAPSSIYALLKPILDRYLVDIGSFFLKDRRLLFFKNELSNTFTYTFDGESSYTSYVKPILHDKKLLISTISGKVLLKETT